MKLTFNAVSESQPGPKWKNLFHRYWPSYKAWYQKHNRDDRPSSKEARGALSHYMPELAPTFDRLLNLAGGGDMEASFLSCYRPPAYLISCSQAVLSRPGNWVLARNYDLDPNLNEGLIIRTAWSGRPVMATSEFLWGVADGMNDAGLALSLAFGGSRSVGDGFGMPLILRYLLEVCDDLDDAISVLRRVPSHMVYNVTVVDRRGNSATVQVGPDRPTRVVRPAIATNHQGSVEWAEHGRFTSTLEREDFLRECINDLQTTDRDFIQSFLQPPLYNTDYQRGFGTLYTAVYRPEEGIAQWHWPNEVWEQSFADFSEDRRHVHYSTRGAKVAGCQPNSRARVSGQEASGGKRRHRWTDKDRSGALLPVLAALRAGFSAGGGDISPELATWLDEAERGHKIKWEKLGCACARQFDLS